MKKTILYISPSEFPSKSANSIHVVYMSEAYAKLGFKVTLFGVSSSKSNFLNDFYGIENENLIISPIFQVFSKGREFIISIFSILKILKYYFFKKNIFLIHSRNIYASFILSLLFNYKTIYETHTLEKGFRKKIQKYILKSKNQISIVISDSLKNILFQEYNFRSKNVFVMHDAARFKNFTDIYDLDDSNQKYSVGYFGSLHEGRGIDLIIKVAQINPNIDFYVYGGNYNEINKFKSFDNSNIKFEGFIEPKNVSKEMLKMDLLLMPYQKKVSIGVKNVDTSRWMSPMKLFEYMSAKKPIISSDHEVLNEVLTNNYNCIMLPENDYKLWSKTINYLKKDKTKSIELASNAYNQYLKKYTWDHRAKNIIKILTKNL